MLALLHISPILLIFIMLMVLRRPPLEAAFVAVVLVVLMWMLQLGVVLEINTLWDVIKDTGVLFTSTAVVIAPGLAFVILIERNDVNIAVAEWVKRLGWSQAQQVIFITLGLAPLLESMTGFGVSLIATVPLLLALFARETALRVALSGMVIMPWGTLGLATVVGAALAGLPANVLGQASSIVSAPVFLLASGLALWMIGERRVSAWGQLLFYWSIFVVTLYCANRLLGPEVAGISAALVVLVPGLFVSLTAGHFTAWPKLAWPYIALLGIIIIIKMLLTLLPSGQSITITGVDVSWQPLSSPGLALTIVVLLVIFLSHNSRLTQGFLQAWLSRCTKPLLTIFFFLLLSQAMLKGGFLDTFQNALGLLSTATLAPVAAILAGLSGYITGSNVGGNAIFMPTLAHLPFDGSTTLWLSAIQNSGAGHGAMGALSILALIAGLAKISKSEESRLVRYGVLLMFFNILLIAAMGSLLILFSAHTSPLFM